MGKINLSKGNISNRALHLIDIENEVCGRVTPFTCREFYRSYNALRLLGPLDHVIVGVSPQSLADTSPLPAGWRRVMGPKGTQSADQALLDAEPPLAALRTYSELILASSDGGFLDLVLRAKAAGLRVTVVSNMVWPPEVGPGRVRVLMPTLVGRKAAHHGWTETAHARAGGPQTHRG